MRFSVIGKVTLLQSGNPVTFYNFTDAGILNTISPGGRLYYRLKMIDVDGQVDYSKMVTVSTEQNSGLIVKAYPDPFNNEIMVRTEMMRAGKINLSLSDMWGRVVRSTVVWAPAGENKIPFMPPAQLPNGTYFLRVQINDKVTTLKLVK
jgi:hypothetical protein